MMLRESVKVEFINVLDDSYFTAQDFIINYWDELDPDYLCRIYFRHDDKYFFEIKVSKNKLTSFPMYNAQYSPGAFKMIEKDILLKDFKSIFDYIDAWTKHIKTELVAVARLSGDYNSINLDIEKYFSISDDDENIFSVSEINELREKFAKLEAKMTELEREHLVTKSQLDEILTAIKEVDQDIDNLPKKVWAKTSVNKITKAIVSIAKTKEGRSLLAKGAGKLLGLD
jgi:transcription termination factor NusB